MGLHKKKGTPGLAVIARERSKSKTTVKYSINDAAFVPFRFIGFSPLTVSDIYGLKIIRDIIYITEIVENCSFWIFGDLLEKLRRKLSDFFWDFGFSMAK